MRVLQVLLSPRVGGAETLVAELAESWRRSGHVSEVAYLDDGPARRSRRDRWSLLRHRVDDFGPDVVLSHSALPNVYARLAVRRGGRGPGGTDVPVVTVLHSAADDHTTSSLYAAERLLRRRTAHVVAVSPVQVEDYLAHFPRAAEDISVVPNGVRDDVAPVAVPRPRPRSVGVLARVVEQKRPDVWVGAARAVQRERPDLQFSWWGTRPPQVELERLTRRGPSTFTDTSFRGAAPHVPAALQDLDVYLHTSDREAMSVALLEAACSGLPIVCSDAVAATLPPGPVVEAFRAGDTQDAARALKEVLDGYPERLQRARTAAPGMRSRFGMEACAASYLRLLEASLVA